MKEKVILLSHDTADGYDFMRDDVPLGKVYIIDRSQAQKMVWGKTDGRPNVERLTVPVYEPTGEIAGWLPLELFSAEHMTTLGGKVKC